MTEIEARILNRFSPHSKEPLIAVAPLCVNSGLTHTKESLFYAEIRWLVVPLS